MADRPDFGSRTIAGAKSLGSPSTRGRFLRIRDVIATVGLGRTTIYRMIEAGLFPKPYALTKRAVGWWESDVVEWLESRRKPA